MRQYLELLQAVVDDGEAHDDRTGVGTRSLFGWQTRFDLADGFPLLTTKRVHVRSVIYELLWFLSGHTDNAWLNERKVSIWDEWATPEQTARFGRPAGDLGPVYGHQWRNFGATRRPDGTYRPDGVDQLQRVVEEIRANPHSRRLIVTGWNPAEAEQVALPPCHTLFQFHVSSAGRLSCQLYQRSADVFLGVPFNIASYALLTHMVAHVCGLQPGTFVHSFGDVHLYNNHQAQAALQLTPRTRPAPPPGARPGRDRAGPLHVRRHRHRGLRPPAGHPRPRRGVTGPLAAVPDRPGPAIVVAVARGGAIGRSGDLPWHTPEDLAHFKALTMGHHVVMGATTWASIGRPLPGRTLVVVSHRRLDLPAGVVLAGSPEDGLDLALAADDRPVVAGGTAIYAALLPRVVRIHRTDVAVDVPDADAHFPSVAPADWAEVARWAGEDDRLTFRVLDRRGPDDLEPAADRTG